jgi:mannose-6-phosphate isomerase-like protein (cupin superfamily)
MKSLPIKFVPKGWGWESHIVNKQEYCGKILFFKKGFRCSFHHHLLKDETFFIQSGRLQIWYSDNDDLATAKTEILEAGDVFYVPVGMRHQMLGLLDTYMFEFSTQHFDEDSIRVIKGD